MWFKITVIGSVMENKWKSYELIVREWNAVIKIKVIATIAKDKMRVQWQCVMEVGWRTRSRGIQGMERSDY